MLLLILVLLLMTLGSGPTRQENVACMVNQKQLSQHLYELLYELVIGCWSLCLGRQLTMYLR